MSHGPNDVADLAQHQTRLRARYVVAAALSDDVVGARYEGCQLAL